MRSALTRNDLRLLPSAVLTWALAVLGITLGAAVALASCAAVIALVLTGTVLRGRPGTFNAVLAHLGILALAGVLLFPALLRHDTAQQALEDASARGLVVEVAVVLRGEPGPPTGGPEWSRSGAQAMARTLRGDARLGKDRVDLPASLPVLVRAGEDATKDLLRARDGDTVLLRGRIRASGGLLVLTAREVRTVPISGPGGLLQGIRHSLRADARKATSHLPADEAALVRGMSTGDTSGLGEESEEIMRRAGISHLVAVSGANIALVLAAVLIPLLLAGVRRRPRLLIGAVVMAAYVGLVGDEPSVQRAATMATPLLIARFAGVRASPVASLSLTVALWSVLDPVTSASVGFALSALATAAILLAAPPLAAALVDLSGDRLGEVPALVIAVPLVAQIACTPILVTLSPEVSAWAVPVNMAVGPLVGPTTVIGLVALLLGVVWPAGAEALNTVAGGGAHVVLLIARGADALPGSRIPVPEGTHGVLLMLALITLGVIAVIGRRSPAVRWGLAALLVATSAPDLARRLPLGDRQEWTVAACAVGQGDAVLLRSGEATVLVDTGPDPAALRECLDRLDIARIDLLVLTHPHADHTGGRSALTGNRTPGQQWVCPLPEAAGQVAPAAPVTAVTTGHTWTEGGLDLEVLWPGSAEQAETASAREDGSGEGDAANDCSIVLAATWPDGTRLVALGDLEPVAQRELAALDPGPADVVKVAHHGSRRQHDALYHQLDPEIALITVGEENSFGHPTDHALQLVGSTGAQTLRTDLHGTVILPVPDPTVPEDSAEPRSVGPPR